MTRSVEQPQAITSIFVYGTLRDDDDSGAPWTRNFVADVDKAQPATMACVQLYRNPRLPYPFALLTGVQEHITVGRLLTWHDAALFVSKLQQADTIEGYRPDGTGEYARTILPARLGCGHVQQAYVYYQQKNASAELIEGGDWLKVVKTPTHWDLVEENRPE